MGVGMVTGSDGEAGEEGELPAGAAESVGLGGGALVEHLDGEERGQAAAGGGSDEEDRAHCSPAQDTNRPDPVQIQRRLIIHLNLDRPTHHELQVLCLIVCLNALCFHISLEFFLFLLVTAALASCRIPCMFRLLI